MQHFDKLLFTEMRAIYYSPISEETYATNEQLQQAMTVQENLRSLGYTLTPPDVVKLATSEELNTLYDTVKEWTPSSKAKPMYPNFPTQVMEMDESEYRFHQLVHYFSTYGLETLLGVEVRKGWLPTVEDTEKTKEDTKLLQDKVLKLVTSEDVNQLISQLLQKKERFTLPEKELIQAVYKQTTILNELMIEGSLEITFKENIAVLFVDEFLNTDDNDNMKDTVRLLRKISKHSGDVLDAIWQAIQQNNYHQFRTSQKKALVKALEKFSLNDLSENLALKRERNLTILRYLSFNRFARAEYVMVATQLREDKLHTWNSQVELLLATAVTYEDKKKTLQFIAQRGGMLLRMVARLLRLGYKKELISIHVNDVAPTLKTQTIVSTLNSIMNKRVELVTEIRNQGDKAEVALADKLLETYLVYDIMVQALYHNLHAKQTPLKNKTLYLEDTIYNLDKSIIETNDKAENGGYIRSGLAIQIPEDIERLRFFTYWNDDERIDIDLHAHFEDKHGFHHSIDWYSDYKNNFACMSGDITHSNASEYIDVDLAKAIEEDMTTLVCEIKSYTGVPFKDIEIVYTGMLAVDKIGADVDLVNAKNIFFTHDLVSNATELKYCRIDLEGRTIQLLGKKGYATGFSLLVYLEQLFLSQNVDIANTREEADIILSVDRTEDSNNICLIDNNYFMDM